MRQIQIAGFLFAAFFSCILTATAFSAETVLTVIECETGALKVEANEDNSMSREDLLGLHHLLVKNMKAFDVVLKESKAPAVAYSVIQYNYDENAKAKKAWAKIQRDLLKIKTVKLSCDELEEQQEEQEGGAGGGSNLF